MKSVLKQSQFKTFEKLISQKIFKKEKKQKLINMSKESEKITEGLQTVLKRTST